MKLNIDCRHYVGDRPCTQNRLCEGCEHYDPVKSKVLIIKLGAAGDVLRTTPLVAALKKRNPSPHVTWLTEATAFDLLRYVPQIDRLLLFGQEALARLRIERFDEVYCFDKEAHASVLATEVQAEKRIGYGFSPEGGPCPLNPESDYLFSLGLSDDLKFRENAKTYQELIFEACGLSFAKEEYLLEIPEEIRTSVQRGLRAMGSSGERLRIGLNTGAGPVFANKAWAESRLLEFIELASAGLNADVLLLGGPDEEEMNARILEQSQAPVIPTGCHNPVIRFAAIVQACDLLVAGDTMALHLGIGARRPVVALFGSTCHQEVELYGRGEKIVTPLDCSPCYRRECQIKPSCMEMIQAATVFESVKHILHGAGAPES